MNKELQRIAIAEACGWELISNGLRPMWSWQNESLIHRIKWVARKEMASQGVLPDYLNDLNAMHEAEKTLDDDLDLDYSENIEIATGARWGANNSYDMSKYRSATAEQRAEAFLRSIGKWEEQ